MSVFVVMREHDNVIMGIYTWRSSAEEEAERLNKRILKHKSTRIVVTEYRVKD